MKFKRVISCGERFWLVVKTVGFCVLDGLVEVGKKNGLVWWCGGGDWRCLC